MPNPESPLIHLWPTTLLVSHLPQQAEVNPRLKQLFADYRTAHPGPAKTSYVSPDNFAQGLEHPDIDTLKKFIMDQVYIIAKELNQVYWRQFKLQDITVDITGMWFQISNDHSFHETHVHGNCSWSGVYYVQAGETSQSKEDTRPNGMPNGITRFYGPQMEYSAGGHGDWGNYYLQHNTHTSYPQDGMLIIFPSYLKHMALPYIGQTDRIIVSFHAQVNSPTQIEYRYSFG